MRVLVIGSTGAIGSHLCEVLRRKGNEVIGASRHIDGGGENSVTLDLANTANAIEAVRNLPKFDAVVISAGVTSLRGCEQNPELSRIINVSSQVELAKWFVESGCKKVIFLSSNRVFDGKTSNVKSETKYSPTTEYGRQKAQAEMQILSLGDAVRIVRFTKVLSEDSKFLVEWVTNIKEDQKISAFIDVSISPITRECACAVIESALFGETESIVQASASDEVSYFEMARSIAEQLDADQSNVCEQTADELGEISLLHSSLESSILTSIEPTSSLSAVRQIVEKMVRS